MAASATDKFKKQSNNFSTTTTTLIVGTTDTSVTLSSVSGLPTDTGIVLVIDRVDANGNKTSSKREYVQGIVSGSSVINLVRGLGGSTAQSHSIGAVVEQVFDQSTWNDTVSGILTQHTQTGTHTGITTDTLTSTGNVVIGGTLTVGGSNPIATGWNSLSYTPNTVVYNGNRSYTCTINAVDATGTLSPGMRIQTTRTVAAPTQCTSLNGTTQYYSKTSPAGMTFTNNFVVSAWVKLSSYAASSIASRYNGTSGWDMQVTATGQVALLGYNGASSNLSYVSSFQSIPLNKWVHIAAQLDMATFTATTTTSYTMIDGVDVPASLTRQGTNPISLVQAGNLEIGSRNSGLQPFPGKIAQVAIYNAKVTQANIVATISQGLSGSETSLISAYSFNNSINDLNTTNANNLTANNGAVATASDTPFTTTQALTGYTVGTTNFAEVISISYSTNTTLVVKASESDTLPTTGGINALSYSAQYEPFAYPNQDSLKTTAIYNPYKFSVYANANQTIVTNTNTKINLNAKTFDTSNNFDTTTNYRFTAPVPGFYYFTACVYITATVSYIIPFLYKNNLNVLQGTTNYGAAGQDQQVTVSGLLQLTANDYVELFVVQYSGSNKTTLGSSYVTYMHGYLVSAT